MTGKLESKMAKGLDLTGRRFGKLVGDSRAANTESGRSQWNCVCDCAISTGSRSKFVARTDNLMSGKTTSCGCKGTGRPTDDGQQMRSNAAPDNAPVRKIHIAVHYCKMAGGDICAYGVATGDGIVNDAGAKIRCLSGMDIRPQLYNFSGKVPAPIVRTMDMLMSLGYVEPQGDRTYKQWITDCGVGYEGKAAQWHKYGDTVSLGAAYKLA